MERGHGRAECLSGHVLMRESISKATLENAVEWLGSQGAFEGDADPADLVSNLFEMEWPPRSGRLQSFPEVDRVRWFGFDEARRKLIAGQAPFVDVLAEYLEGRRTDAGQAATAS